MQVQIHMTDADPLRIRRTLFARNINHKENRLFNVKSFFVCWLHICCNYVPTPKGTKVSEKNDLYSWQELCLVPINKCFL